MIRQDALRYNLAIHNANVRTMVRFAAAGARSFMPETFISALASLEQFPYVSVREMLSAAVQADADILAKKASLAEVMLLNRTAILPVERQLNLKHSIELLQLCSVSDDSVTLLDHSCEKTCIKLSDLERIYVGFVYLHQMEVYDALPCKLLASADITRKVAFALGSQCNRLRDLCDEIGYRPVLISEPSLSVMGDATAESGVLFGADLDLASDRAGVVTELLEQAACVFETCKDNVEGFHIRRLFPDDRIPLRFDNGVNLQRGKALHLIFGEACSAMEVSEGCSGRGLRLLFGDAMVVNSADDFCRTRWQSGWSAVSKQGDCYIASCWHRWL